MPIILAVPHAGRDYPQNILDDIRLSVHDLLRLEDRFVDLLVRKSAAQAVPTLIAKAPRAIIDLNRAEDEIDADMISGMDWSETAHPSAKTRGGLGLFPRRLSGVGDIWKAPLDRQVAQQRIHIIHRPYHEYLEAIIARTKAKFGIALLLDIHSMPSLSQAMPNGKTATLVVGDRFSASADNIYSDLIVSHMEQNGFDVALNMPYSGGYILQRHGKTQVKQHAIQIEIDRSLYLCENHREPSAGINLMASYIQELVEHLLENMMPQHYEAAE